MRKFLALLVMTMFCVTFSYAQREVKGTVVDANNAPIEGASVELVGTNRGTSTDASGNFSLVVPVNGRITISAVGQQSQTVNTGSGLTLTVRMQPSNNSELTTVVVTTALNVQRQASELGYSTAKVRAAELTQAKTVNVQNGLTGKVSGLNIQTVDNGVFANTRITLRGIRSLTGNNQPMLIVDGVPIALSYLSSINPNDIKDVTILKSSSSTAIYGPEGVNGAIVITTTRGFKNRPQFTVSHTTQFEQVSFMPLFQNQFGSGSSEDANGQGVYDPIENQQYGDAFDGSIRGVGRVFPSGDTLRLPYRALPNEKKKFWDVGVTNQTDVSFSTGDFYMSAQHVDIKGITPKDENRRIAVTLGANKDYNRLRASYTLRYTNSKYNVNAGNFWGGRDYTPYWNLINTPAQIPITQYKNWQTDYFANPNGYYNDYYFNPYFMVDNFRQDGRTDDIFGNVELNYKLTDWLTATYRLGNTYSSGANLYTQGAFTYSDFAKASGKSNAQTGDIVAGVANTSSYSNRLNSEIYLTAAKKYKDFRFDVILGQNYRRITGRSQNLSSDNLGIPNVFNTSVRKGELSGGESRSDQRLQRFFGKVGIGYKGWIFGEFTGSYDQDSRLANPYNYNVDDISFFYPGASLSFVATEAFPSLKSKTLSFLKIRGAVSKTGNVNLGPYNLENTYSQPAGFPFGNILGFTANDVLRQSSYKPEFVRNKEVGLEIGLNNNKINFEATAYRQENTNQIIQAAYSSATGYPGALLNAADFTNQGIELDLKLTPIIKLGDFSVDYKINYAFQENKVNALVTGVDELGIGNGNFVIVGAPAYTFKLTDYVRDSVGRVIVDATTGLPRLDPNTKRFGQTLPKHLVGNSLSVNWRNITLNLVADYRTGNQIFNGIGPDMDFAGLSIRSAQNGRQPFLFPNSAIESPIGSGKYVANTNVYTTGGYNFWSQSVNTAVNSNYISSGAFWKLRELSMSYTFPSTMFKGKGLKGMQASITGRNLATWLPRNNQWTDPEFSNTTGNAQGVNDRNNTPPTRIFGANLTLNF